VAAIDLCTLEDVRGELEQDSADTERDPLIESLITPVSQAIIDEVNRELAPPVASATRRFRVKPKRLVNGAVFVSLAAAVTGKSETGACDLRTVTSMTLHPESDSPTVLAAGVGGYVLDVDRFGLSKTCRISLQAGFSSDTYSDFGFCYLDVAGAWGFEEIPLQAKQAAILTVMAWMRRDVSVFLEAERDPSAMKPTMPPTYALPLAAKQQLAPLYRQRVF
jgi:hypothetical protein